PNASAAPPSGASKPPQRRQEPLKNRLTPAQIKAAVAPAKGARRVPLEISPLDDDLVLVKCSSGECNVLGRSGRIYAIAAADHWTFVQGSFKGPKSAAVSLLYATSDDLFVKAGDLVVSCPTVELGNVDIASQCTLNGAKFTSAFGETYLSGKASEKE